MKKLLSAFLITAVFALADPPKSADKITLDNPIIGRADLASVAAKMKADDNIKLLYLYFNLAIFNKNKEAACDAAEGDKDYAFLCGFLKKEASSWEERWNKFMDELKSIYHGTEIEIDESGVATVK